MSFQLNLNNMCGRKLVLIAEPSAIVLPNKCFHSTYFPSEWGLTRQPRWCLKWLFSRFHSTYFPSEWGLTLSLGRKSNGFWPCVSIQLISPASRDWRVWQQHDRNDSFPFNLFPQRVGTSDYYSCKWLYAAPFPFNLFPQRVGTTGWRLFTGGMLGVSIQLISPASGDTAIRLLKDDSSSRFPFNLFPQRVGTLDSLFNLEVSYSEFPFNLFPQRVGTFVPNCSFLEIIYFVSIQLISPASGDIHILIWGNKSNRVVSIQLISPASGNSCD